MQITQEMSNERNERQKELLDYFDLAWQIFTRLDEEGKLDELNLTTRRLNPTVKPENVLQQDQPINTE